jgi:LPXTG-motif cell wall-anchored protein
VSRDAEVASGQTSLAQLGSALVIGLLAVAGFFFWRRSKS